jgi:hypothetical protein
MLASLRQGPAEVQRQTAFDMPLRSFRVGTREFAEFFLTDCACSNFEDGVCRHRLARRKVIAIELEKKHAHNKTGVLVAIDEGMILYDAGRVLRCGFNDVRIFGPSLVGPARILGAQTTAAAEPVC